MYRKREKVYTYISKVYKKGILLYNCQRKRKQIGFNLSMKRLPPDINIELIETREVLKKLTSTRAALAELKGVADTIPNERILIDTLSLQEAKESSAIENIVTTHDEIYQGSISTLQFSSTAAKEVQNYAKALHMGFREVKQKELITTNLILRIQQIIEGNNAGMRKVPGTVLKNDLTGEIVYEPPQHAKEIELLMENLEWFINAPNEYAADPLVRMAIIHHQFESIHPFYDGNGRTGRIINILYLIKSGLLGLPILYISRYIIKNRVQYYSLLQQVRETDKWEPWILYMLNAVESTSIETVITIKEIKILIQQYKNRIRSEEPKIYSQDLINNLFRHPYTKIELLKDDLKVTRITAARYLDRLSDMGMLNKIKLGRSNYYINAPLLTLLQRG